MPYYVYKLPSQDPHSAISLLSSPIYVEESEEANFAQLKQEIQQWAELQHEQKLAGFSVFKLHLDPKRFPRQFLTEAKEVAGISGPTGCFPVDPSAFALFEKTNAAAGARWASLFKGYRAALSHFLEFKEIPCVRSLDKATNLELQTAPPPAFLKLIDLLRNHNIQEANDFLNKEKAKDPTFANFVGRPQQQASCALTLMALGRQREAEVYIRKHPALLLMKGTLYDQDGYHYQRITVYQYALCLKHTQLLRMIKKIFAEKFTETEKLERALQANEVESGRNPEINLLCEKYKTLGAKTLSAYAYYNLKHSEWPAEERQAYVAKKLGQLQTKWPLHWMQELCKKRAFNKDTCFGDESALAPLPEAQFFIFYEALPIYPLRKSYEEGYIKCLELAEEAKPDLNLFSKFYATLVKQGDRYYLYLPAVADESEARIGLNCYELAAALINAIVPPLTFPPLNHYWDGLQPWSCPNEFREHLSAAGVPVHPINSGLSFTFALNNSDQGQGPQAHFSAPNINEMSRILAENLDGLKALFTARDREYTMELAEVREFLPAQQSEEKSSLAPKLTGR